MTRGHHPLSPLVLLAALLLAGCGPTHVLDHAEDGTPILIRSPQPDVDDLEELHAEHGVRTVINLRGYDPDDGWFQEEAEGVDAIKARWVHLDTSGSHPPHEAQIQLFRAVVENPENWPIVMHCQGGIHRTGLWVAFYRMQYQGWTPEQALAELEDNYFNWTTRDRDEIKDYIRGFRPDPDAHIDRKARAGRPPGEQGRSSEPPPSPDPPARHPGDPRATKTSGEGASLPRRP